ncbi:FMN-binding split barrel [Glarea lozoyensis ATCC 20868]|uniref:FMN-binding split barrel n=1 Tax=Glarea lozoyensis (strain ATCC 20868 / MF5171) TaxID=1116229 RepID=S3E707_GLAL2|nr:FMN-binding split barrel [Glarea lozoyensis ATCC 20868]EPE34138.1 FMN-binding split barrel [Glarea lozoyensis ATCC 20868]
MGDAEYPKVPRSTINRYRPRGKYDYQTIHSIVNSVPVVHVSFATPDPEDPFPAALPMIGFLASFENQSASLDDALDLYLHGYVSSRLMKMGKEGQDEEGLPITVAATHFDGIVLALTPNSHSYNYRSAILHGYATPVTEVDEKLWAMEKITNSVVSDRWDNTRVPPNKTEMTSTQILRIRIVSASAKIRAGQPHDERKDMKDEEMRKRVWTGVVPTWTSYGEPQAGPDNLAGTVPEYVKSFVKKANENGQKRAHEAMVEPKK